MVHFAVIRLQKYWGSFLLDVIVGQMRVRVMETLYSVDLRHHEAPADSSEEEEKQRMMGRKVHVTSDWLCAWLGSEHLCVNVSRRLGDWGAGEIHTELSHSFHLLNSTGDYYYIYIYCILYIMPSPGLSASLSSGCRCTCQQ